MKVSSCRIMFTVAFAAILIRPGTMYSTTCVTVTPSDDLKAIIEAAADVAGDTNKDCRMNLADILVDLTFPIQTVKKHIFLRTTWSQREGFMIRSMLLPENFHIQAA